MFGADCCICGIISFGVTVFISNRTHARTAPHHTALHRTVPRFLQAFLFYWLLGPNVTAFRRNRALRGRIAPFPGAIGNSIAIFSARVVSATEEVRGERGEKASDPALATSGGKIRIEHPPPC